MAPKSTFVSVLTSTASVIVFGLLTISAAQSATITGKVSDQSGRINFPGAQVRIPELNLTTTSTDGGAFRFSNVPVGTHTLTVSYVGAEAVSQIVTVTAPDQVLSGVTIAIGRDVLALENVLVVGQAAASANAINRQRNADGFVSAVTSDNIGQFPDQNASEATRRMPGLTVENDQGEGRFVVVRGINSALNATSINGLRVGAPESDTRGVALDVVPSDLISAIEVRKSFEPDMDGDMIGGSIEIETASAFDRDGFFLTARAEGVYNDKGNRFDPRLSASASHTFSDKFGLSGSISWFDRTFPNDNKEVDEVWLREGNVDYPGELEFREYNVTRVRFGASLNADFRPNDSTDLYIRSLYNAFSDQEFRHRVEWKLDDADFVSGNATSALLDGEVGVDRDLKDRYEIQKIYSVLAGGESYVDNWTLEYSVGYSQSGEYEDALDTIDMAADFNEDGDVPNFGIGVDYSNPMLPVITYPNTAMEALFNDPNNYEFDELTEVDQTTEEKEWAFKADVRYDTSIGSYPAYLKFGGKIRLREKFTDTDENVFDGYTPGDLTLNDVLFADGVDYPLDNFGPAVSVDALRALGENLSAFELNGDDTAEKSAEGDYTANEDIYAGYIMGSVDIDRLRVVAGVRIEHTEFKSTGNQLFFLEGDLDSITPVTRDKSYTDILPALTLRYQASDQIVLRAAASRTIFRPNISDVVTRANINDEDGELEGSFGNPALKPYRSTNLDAAIEFYPTNLSIISAGVFYKGIDNFIVDANLGGTGDFTAFDDANIAINGDKADLFGIELAYQQKLEFLPAPFDGVLIGANYTYTDSEGTLADGTKVPFPAQANHIGNVSIGYEKGPLSLRAALAFRGSYLDVLNEGEVAGERVNRFVDGHTQLDLSGKYQITDQFQVFMEASNITDEPFYAYFDSPQYLSQYEEYGFTLFAGVRFTY